MLFNTFFDIVMILFQAVQAVLVIYIILGLLFAFNVISASNRTLLSIYQSLEALMAPLLNPIRRILPDTGGMDFSPLVLVVLMNIITRILVNYQMTYVA